MNLGTVKISSSRVADEYNDISSKINSIYIADDGSIQYEVSKNFDSIDFGKRLSTIKKAMQNGHMLVILKSSEVYSLKLNSSLAASIWISSMSVSGQQVMYSLYNFSGEKSLDQMYLEHLDRLLLEKDSEV